MKIIIKKFCEYPDVKIEHGGTTIELGLLDADERETLSRELIDAVWAFGPTGQDDCAEWLMRLLVEQGIELPNAVITKPTPDLSGTTL